MHARLVTAAAAALLTLSLVAPPVAAGENDDIATNPFIRQTGPTTVDVGVQTTVDGERVSRSGPRGVAACQYGVYGAADARATILQLLGIDIGDLEPDVRYVFRVCRTGTVDLVATYRVGDPIAPVLVDALTAAAYDQLQVPVLRPSSAPLGDEAAPLVVQLPTWLWLDAADWQPVRAEAAVPGARVVAVASPVEARWEPWPGATVLCAGPGVAYDFNRADDAQSTDCSFTYQSTTATQPSNEVPLRTTVSWSVTWVCEPACGSGSLPAFEITASRPVRVAEVQALNTRSIR